MLTISAKDEKTTIAHALKVSKQNWYEIHIFSGGSVHIL